MHEIRNFFIPPQNPPQLRYGSENFAWPRPMSPLKGPESFVKFGGKTRPHQHFCWSHLKNGLAPHLQINVCGKALHLGKWYLKAAEKSQLIWKLLPLKGFVKSTPIKLFSGSLIFPAYQSGSTTTVLLWSEVPLPFLSVFRRSAGVSLFFNRT